MDEILEILQSFLAGTRLTLPAAAFGPGGVETVLSQYFADGIFIADGVTLTPQGGSVLIEGATVLSLPLSGMTFDATFAPGANGATLDLTATPPAGWSFSTGWPLLAGTAVDGFTVAEASFTLKSFAVGLADAGLAFSGTLGFPAEWSLAQWLVAGAATFPCSGPIGQSGAAPELAFQLAVAENVTVPMLGSLTVTAELSSAPIAMTEPLEDILGGVFEPWVPLTAFVVSSSIEIAGQSVGITIDLSNPFALIPVSVDVASLATVTLADLAPLLGGTDLAAYLPPASVFDPGSALVPHEILLSLDPNTPSITSVALILGSQASWPLLPEITLTAISLQILVPIGSASPIVSVIGNVALPGGDLQLGAAYPSGTVTGALAWDAEVNLGALLSRLLPEAPAFPLLLDDLDFVIQPTAGTFSLTVGLTGDWSIPTGIATISLTNAWLQLDRSLVLDGEFKLAGALGVSATLGSVETGEALVFSGSWAIPGPLVWSGTFPEVPLTRIAQSIAGAALPQGTPDIAMTNGAFLLSLDSSSGVYDFELAMTASIGGTPAGNGVVVVRESDVGFGVLAAFAAGESWTPSTAWPALEPIFGNLTFLSSALLVSTLPAGSSVALPLQIPGLPLLADPGVAVAGTVALSGAILGPLAPLFPSGLTFDLLAVVDTAVPAATQIVASFHGSSPAGSVTFTGVAVTMQPQLATCSITAAAALATADGTVELSGSGSITLGAEPKMALTIELASWANAFGIHNLTLEEFGLQLGYESGALTVAVVGSFDIGPPARQLTLTVGGELVDFELPGALLFELEDANPDNPLMLTDVLAQLTTIDLSAVPVLDAVGFTTLSFWVVADPAGLTLGGYHFPPGIGIAADIFIYSWEATFNLQVGAGSLIASGSLNAPISLAGGAFTLSNAAGTQGPSASIDTTASPYFTLDGQVSFLGIAATVSAAATGSTFDFAVEVDFGGAVTATLACQLLSATEFNASSSFTYALDVTVGPLVEQGITLLPQFQVQAEAAVSLALAIHPEAGVQASGALSFIWNGATYGGQFTLTAAELGGSLANLESALATWLQNNVGTVFASLVSNAGPWVSIVQTVFGTPEVGGISNVTRVLATLFGVSPENGAAFLKQLLFGFNPIVDSLVTGFQVVFDAAVDIVSALFGGGGGGGGGGGDGECSIAKAESSAFAAPTILVTTQDLRFVLTSGARGQRLLTAYYEHGEEIWALLAAHPMQRAQLQSLERSTRGGNDLERLGDTVIRALTAIAPRASEPLRHAILEWLPELARYRRLTHAQLLAEVSR